MIIIGLKNTSPNTFDFFQEDCEFILRFFKEILHIFEYLSKGYSTSVIWPSFFQFSSFFTFSTLLHSVKFKEFFVWLKFQSFHCLDREKPSLVQQVKHWLHNIFSPSSQMNNSRFYSKGISASFSSNQQVDETSWNWNTFKFFSHRGDTTSNHTGIEKAYFQKNKKRTNFMNISFQYMIQQNKTTFFKRLFSTF